MVDLVPQKFSIALWWQQ